MTTNAATCPRFAFSYKGASGYRYTWSVATFRRATPANAPKTNGISSNRDSRYADCRHPHSNKFERSEYCHRKSSWVAF